MSFYNTFYYPFTREYYGKYAGPYHTQAERPNDEICRDVCERLKENGWLDETQVNVKVVDGRVNLSGTVDSIQAKRSAGDDAWDVPGVLDVVNQLQIAGRGGEREGKKPDDIGKKEVETRSGLQEAEAPAGGAGLALRRGTQ